jgi:hypothetical protein
LATGKRTWDREKFPELEKYFFVLVISHIRNLAKGKNDHLNIDEVDFCLESDKQASHEETKELVEFYAPNYQNDMQLAAVLWKIIDEDTNSEIAADLHIGVRSVVNAKRRIQRMFGPLLKTYHRRMDPIEDR